jgi:hypothetical protein
MKKKLGTRLDEEVIKPIKRRAAEEGSPLSDVIQDALPQYLSSKVPDHRKRAAAYRTFCERPLRLNREQFNHVLEGDGWDS